MLADEDHRGDPGLLKACGKPLPGVELRIVDTEGRTLPAGAVGEIAVRSPTVMKGYWQRPEETAKVMRDGWYLTGDAGNFDEAGYLFIRDRIKDMVVSGGENVYPTEVEIALRRHAEVTEVAVIGVPDAKWGEAVKAVVVRQPGSELDEAALIAFARDYLAGFKCPKSVDFVEELPKNAAGKVLRRELRQQYWSRHERQVG
jgi:acyl-CoA synthetase (AMP-forming)/AMP-acid ligase II